MAVFLILIPLIATLVINLPPRRFMEACAPWLVIALALTQIVLALFPSLSFWALPLVLPGIGVLWEAFPHDNLDFVMYLSIPIVGASCLLVAKEILAKKRLFTFCNLALLCIAGMNGIVMVRDLFSLYVFLEITAITSFVLIAIEDKFEGFEGAFKYLVLSALATVLLLSSLGIILLWAPDLRFESLSQIYAGTPSSALLLAAMLFIVGLLIKAGAVPFHGWLPDAYMGAPAPTSILLAGIVTKTTGVYTLIRVSQSVFGATPTIRTALIGIAILTIVVASFAALAQKDFKRLLAYSSIAQVGYIILGVGVGSALGFVGAIFHLFNHAIFKSLLFVNAAAVENKTGTRQMDELGGLATRMPVTGLSSVIASLSTAGIPPLSGFWSKLIIIIALWQAGLYWIAAIAILMSLVTLGYLLVVQRKIFFGNIRAGLESVSEAGPLILTVEIILMLITLGVGLMIPWLWGSYILPIRSLL